MEDQTRSQRLLAATMRHKEKSSSLSSRGNVDDTAVSSDKLHRRDKAPMAPEAKRQRTEVIPRPVISPLPSQVSDLDTAAQELSSLGGMKPSAGTALIHWPEGLSPVTRGLMMRHKVPFSQSVERKYLFDSMWDQPVPLKHRGLGFGDPDADELFILGDEEERGTLIPGFRGENILDKEAYLLKVQEVALEYIDSLKSVPAITEAERSSHGIPFSEIAGQKPSEAPKEVGSADKVGSVKATKFNEVPPPSNLSAAPQPSPSRTEMPQGEVRAATEEIAPQGEREVSASDKAAETTLGEEAQAAQQEQPSVDNMPGEKERIEDSDRAIVILPPTLSAPQSSTLALPNLQGSGYSLIKNEDLQGMVEQILRAKLNKGWPLETFVKKVDDSINRTKETEDTIKELSGQLDTRVETLESLMTNHESQLLDLSEDTCHSFHGAEANQSDIAELKERMAAAELSIKNYQAEILRLSSSNKDEWAKHDLIHTSIESRINTWSELRRLDQLSQSVDNSAEANKLRMEGIQLCIDYFIAKGYFPRDLLQDPCFMDMVKDRDGLILKLNTDTIVTWRQGGSGRGYQESRPLREMESTSRSQQGGRKNYQGNPR